jgi:hypothetical protein
MDWKQILKQNPIIEPDLGSKSYLRHNKSDYERQDSVHRIFEFFHTQRQKKNTESSMINIFVYSLGI